MFCKTQGIERVAEQLLASQEGLFSVVFIFVPCNDCDSENGGNFQSSYSIISFDDSVHHSLS